MVNLSASKALAGIIVLLVGIGLLLGLALTDSDLVNPIKSVAEFQRDQTETQRIAQENEITLQQYKVLQEARTQAEVERLEEEIRYQRQLHEQELRRLEEETQHQRRMHEQALRDAQKRAALERQLLQLGGYVAIAVLGLALLSLSIGFSVHLAGRRPAHAGTSADVWTPERKRQAIEAARWRERRQREQELHELERREQVLRKQELRQQGFDSRKRLLELSGTSIGSNGHEDADELSSEPWSPLWVYD